MNTTDFEYLCKIILFLRHMRMKMNQEPSGRYVPPRSIVMMICTKHQIMQVSNQVGQWQEGSRTEDDMNEMENGGW